MHELDGAAERMQTSNDVMRRRNRPGRRVQLLNDATNNDL